MHNVPWVAFLYSCLDVLDAVCAPWDDISYDVGSFPGGLEHVVTFLLQLQDQVTFGEAVDAYSSAVIVAECLLIDCRPSEGDVADLI